MSITLTIDGKTVTAQPGEAVLDCALRHDISIPHLCAHPHLPPFGACRMCLVEIEGARGYPASCSTPAAAGMVVQTNTEAVRKLRRGILELILLEHPSACLVCDKSELCMKYRSRAEKAGCTTGCHSCNNMEICDIRVLSKELEVHDLPVPPTYHGAEIERHDPFIDRDLNLCILCGRCVRICKEHQGETTLTFVERGSRARIGEAFGRSLLEAGCRFCGSCVDVCPTGTLAPRYGKWHGKPDSRVETTCTFCDAACAVRVQSSRGRIGDARAVEGGLPLCVLGRFAIPPFLNGIERLKQPYLRIGNVLRESPWPKALEETAKKLRPYIGGGGDDGDGDNGDNGNARFALICDTTCTLEDRHVFKRFTTEVMRSPHYIELEPDARGVAGAELPDGVTAVLLTGPFVAPDELAKLELLIVLDCYPTAMIEHAEVVLPAAIMAEVDGTCVDSAGTRRPLYRAGTPPGKARPEWRIISELARACGAAGFDYDRFTAITGELGNGAGPARLALGREEAPPPALDPQLCRTHFRGHRIADQVRGLESLSIGNGAALAEASGG